MSVWGMTKRSGSCRRRVAAETGHFGPRLLVVPWSITRFAGLSPGRFEMAEQESHWAAEPLRTGFHALRAGGCPDLLPVSRDCLLCWCCVAERVQTDAILNGDGRASRQGLCSAAFQKVETQNQWRAKPNSGQTLAFYRAPRPGRAGAAGRAGFQSVGHQGARRAKAN